MKAQKYGGIEMESSFQLTNRMKKNNFKSRNYHDEGIYEQNISFLLFGGFYSTHIIHFGFRGGAAQTSKVFFIREFFDQPDE